MGQISVEIYEPAGSLLSGNQHNIMKAKKKPLVNQHWIITRDADAKGTHLFEKRAA